MSRIQDMSRLTDQLVRSYEGRASYLANLQTETQQKLQQFAHGRETVAAAQRASLALETGNRRAAMHTTLQELTTIRKAAKSAMETSLNDGRTDLRQQNDRIMDAMRKSREASSATQKASLHRERTELTLDASRALSQLKSSRLEMAEAQREQLNDHRTSLQADSISTLAHFATERKALAENLAEFGKVWHDSARAMRERRHTGSLMPEIPTSAQPEAEAHLEPSDPVEKRVMAENKAEFSPVSHDSARWMRERRRTQSHSREAEDSAQIEPNVGSEPSDSEQ